MRILNPPKKRIVFYIQKGAGILDACAFSFPSRRKTASIIQDAFRDLAFEVSNIHYLPAQPGVSVAKAITWEWADSSMEVVISSGEGTVSMSSYRASINPQSPPPCPW